MNISSMQPFQAVVSWRLGRLVIVAALLIALAAVIFAGDTQPALAQVGIQFKFNYVVNGSFEIDSNGDGIPNDWLVGTLGAKDKRVCNQSVTGSCSFKMVGDGNENYLYQVIPLTGTNAGNEFKFKIWTKGKALNLSGGSARVIVRFQNEGIAGNSESIEIPSGTSAWTLRKVSATAAADYDEIHLFVVLDANSGKAWFDKVTLVYVGGP